MNRKAIERIRGGGYQSTNNPSSEWIEFNRRQIQQNQKEQRLYSHRNHHR